jgi:hypothetical protein
MSRHQRVKCRDYARSRCACPCPFAHESAFLPSMRHAPEVHGLYFLYKTKKVMQEGCSFLMNQRVTQNSHKPSDLCRSAASTSICPSFQ